MTLAARPAIQPAAAPLPSTRLTEYPVPIAGAVPNVLTLGPSGNIWFTKYNAGKVAQITPGGLVTEYMPPSATTLAGIVNGPDGRLWFAEESANSVGRLALPGAFAEFPARVTSREPLGIRAEAGRQPVAHPAGMLRHPQRADRQDHHRCADHRVHVCRGRGAEPQNIVTGPGGGSLG